MGRKYAVCLCAAVLAATLYAYDEHAEYERLTALYREGKTNTAISGYKRILARNPKSEYADEMEYRIAESEEEYFRAIAKWQAFYNRYPEHPRRDEVLFKIARLYLLHSNYSLALSKFQALMKAHPGSGYIPRAGLMCANIYLIKEDAGKAAALYEELITERDDERDALYYEALFGLANARYHMKEYDAARGLYLRVVKETPDFSERPFALYRLALCHDEAGEKEAAIEQYRSVVRSYAGGYAASLASQRLKQHAIPLAGTHVHRDERGKAAAVQLYQAGRFSEHARANALMMKIRALGYRAYVKAESDTYRVLIEIEGGEEAEADLREDLGAAKIPHFRVKE